MSKIIPSRLPNPEALSYLEAKTLIQAWQNTDIRAYHHALGFTVAKMMNHDLLAETKKALEEALKNGTSFAEFKKNLKPYLISKGWWGNAQLINPKTGKMENVLLGSDNRLKRIYETNMRTAYASARWERIQEHIDVFPYLIYVHSHSANPRVHHMNLNGLILPANDPFWRIHFPPNGYGCKCRVRQLTVQQAKEKGGASKNPPRNPNENGIQESFRHNHTDRFKQLNDVFKEKLVQSNLSEKQAQKIIERNTIQSAQFVQNKIIQEQNIVKNDFLELAKKQKVIFEEPALKKLVELRYKKEELAERFLTVPYNDKVSIIAQPNYISFKISNFNEIDLLKRTYFPAENKVKHDFLEIFPEYQGKGIAKEILLKQMMFYRQAGIQKIEIDASLEIGGYAWAKYGFLPTDWLDTKEGIKSRAEWLWRIEKKIRLQDFELILNKLTNNPQSIWELSDLKNENGDKIGKQVLQGFSWLGYFDVNNDDQRRKFYRYILWNK